MATSHHSTSSVLEPRASHSSWVRKPAYLTAPHFFLSGLLMERMARSITPFRRGLSSGVRPVTLAVLLVAVLPLSVTEGVPPVKRDSAAHLIPADVAAQVGLGQEGGVRAAAQAGIGGGGGRAITEIR